MRRIATLGISLILLTLGVQVVAQDDGEHTIYLPLVLGVPSEPGGQKPFGPFDFPPTLGDDWPFSASRLRNDPDLLEAARERGFTVLIALTGSKSRYTDADGCFDLEMWQATLDDHDMTELQPFVDDGTIDGLYAIDEPFDWDCGPTYAQLDQVCAYAQERLPGIRCGFNAPPSWLAEGLDETDYAHVGFFFTQANFSIARDWSAWAAQQIADARGINVALPVYLSMNVISYPPSAAQLQEAGIALCGSEADAVFMWEWQPEEFEALRASMEIIAAACGP
jgi:hypothetical protein